jgi:polysaccharide pyruvyl transferase WcaK-like protein
MSINNKLIIPPTVKYPGSLGDKAILLSIEKNNADLVVCDTRSGFWQDLNFKNIIDINNIDIKKYDEIHFYPTDTIDGAFGDESIDLFYKISSLFTNTQTKIFFNCFSYGPNPTQKSIDYLKNISAIFSLRDEYSLDRFKKFHPYHLCFLQHDPAFNLETKKPNKDISLPINSVGICPANSEYDKYAKIIELCIKKGYSPVLILHDLRPQVGDINLCYKLSENYKLPIIPTEDPREIKYLLSKMQFVVTGRMHVAILAMGTNTKVYGFDYNHKMKGTFKVKNQEKNVIQKIEEIYEIKSFGYFINVCQCFP